MYVRKKLIFFFDCLENINNAFTLPFKNVFISIIVIILVILIKLILLFSKSALKCKKVKVVKLVVKTL